VTLPGPAAVRPALRVVRGPGSGAPSGDAMPPARADDAVAGSGTVDDAVADAVRRELDTAASLLGREMAPSGLDGSLARIARILRARRGHEFVGIW